MSRERRKELEENEKKKKESLASRNYYFDMNVRLKKKRKKGKIYKDVVGATKMKISKIYVSGIIESDLLER